VQRLHTLFHLGLLPAANHWDRQVLEQPWDASERYIRLYVAHQQDGSAVAEVSISSHQVLTDAAGSAKPEQFRAAHRESRAERHPPAPAWHR
jgi:hypothetical protein